jgi:sugar O-acyltransferase (sialic acid O-acetyltransferase NeuD family)
MKNCETLLYIIGCGGHARSVAEVALLDKAISNIIFVDANAKENEKIFGFSVIKELPSNAEKIFVAIGDCQLRKKLSQQYDLINIISTDATIGIDCTIGKGCFIGHKTYIGPEAIIGNGTIINTGAIIEHEVAIGEFCHVAPNTVICGRTKIGDNVFIGAGSVIIDKLSVCSDTCFGAGSVVIKSICEKGTYVGVPVHKI